MVRERRGGAVEVVAIVVVVPAEAGVFHQKLQQANFIPMEGVFQDRGIASVRMALKNTGAQQVANTVGSVQAARAAQQPSNGGQ